MTIDNTPDRRDDEMVREGSSLMAFLYILKKAHAHLVGHDLADNRFHQVVTRGQAQGYITEMMAQLRPERERHRRQGINRR